ncbi:hypothetical protein GCM10007862_03680 [Dyella lipolytica]|uniref:Uncharacterized protein n=1 Tax=Dyella lipolytica TaxID=1867835 RepID=A0ABW8J1I9_9GAMM|nr:DUF6491 family protein [Dyella lipolytica]GLQ45317.1 hypothetical protein GCM10007862_03680 [Dyella lipolytica]
MKPVISVLLTLTVAISAGSLLAQSAPARSTLAYGDCIRIDQINEWHVVDSRTAIVRTGPYQRYLLTLQADCQKLGIGNPGLVLVPSRSDKATGSRMCGGVGEKVRARNQPDCAIQSIRLIGEDQFNSYRAKAQYHSVKTQQPSKNP